MTLKAFFAALERRTVDLDAVWRVNHDGEIRTDDGHCPLSFVADTTPGVVCEARNLLRLPVEPASVVASAADYPESTDWRIRVARARLLETCRLVEAV